MPAMNSIIVASLAALSAAAPTAIKARQSGPYFSPILSTWNSGTSLVTGDTGYGLVQRYAGSTSEISTLATFLIPDAYASNTCELIFTLTADGSNTYGTGQAQVFSTSQQAVDGDTSDHRDQQLASLIAVNGGAATFTAPDGSNPSYWRFQCSELIDNPNLELAPQGENVSIYFGTEDGLQVVVLDA